MNKFSILVVDDIPQNIEVAKGILLPEYSIMAASNGQLALKIAETKQPDIILLDIMMPDMDGFEVCRQLKANSATKNIPVIFVTALDEQVDEEKGFHLGAVEYITKPYNHAILKARVRSHIELAHQQKVCQNRVIQKTRELAEREKNAIYMLAQAGHFNDSDTGQHVWRMSAYAKVIAQANGWTEERVAMLELAAPMHDTGKIAMPDDILKAPRKLTEEEMEVMRTHSTIGYNILSNDDSAIFKLAAEIALYHHEKWDGNGYPEQLSGTEIPESARIVAIADVFDALTMKRPYKKPWTNDDAYSFINDQSGKHFDPNLVKVFNSVRDEIESAQAYWNDKEQHN